MDKRIKKAQEEIDMLNLEYNGLNKYRDKRPLSLASVYLDVANEIKAVSGYYGLVPLVKIPGIVDGQNIEEFFKPSVYKGIRYVDVLCEVNRKDAPAAHLLSMFCAMIKTRPARLSGVNFDMDKLTFNLRLYGL